MVENKSWELGVLLSSGPRAWSEYLQCWISGIPRPNPMLCPQVLLISLPKFSVDYPPLGIASLKAYLVEKNITAQCLDMNVLFYKKYGSAEIFDQFDETYETHFNDLFQEHLRQFLDSQIEKIAEIQPEFVGVSLTSYLSEPSSLYVARKLKELSPNIKIIFGGSSCMRRSYIKHGFVDFVVRGHGEDALYKIIQHSGNTRMLSSVPGISYKKGKKIFESKNMPQVDLDLPFPDFSDFDLGSYGNRMFYKPYVTIPIMASRGCASNCSYCDIHHFWKGYTSRTPDSIIREIQYQKKKYKTFNFVFHDSAINCNLEMLEDLCDMIIKNNIFVLWCTDAKFRPGMNMSIITKLRKAGCYRVVLGLESGSESVRNHMGKTCSNVQIIRQLQMYQRAGIDVWVNLMVGYPAETLKDFQKTISFVSRNRKYFSGIFLGKPCVLIDGSRLRKMSKKMGIKNRSSENWSYRDNNLNERIRRWRTAKLIFKQKGIRILDNVWYRVESLKSSA